MDQNVLIFFASHRTELMTFIMLVVTYCGSYIMISGLSLLSIISFLIHKQFNRIYQLIITISGSAITTFLFKNIIDRARPLLSVYQESGFSFPSGHTSMATALYGFLIYVAWKHDKHHLRNPLIIFLAILIPLIGISRLYLGVHFLSDVLFGFIIGLVWIYLSLKIIKD